MTNLYPSLAGLWQDLSPNNEHQTTSFITMPSLISTSSQKQALTTSGDPDFIYPSLDSDQLGVIKFVKVPKNVNGKIDVQIVSIHSGFFVVFSHLNSPASLASLEFGDQILEINGTSVSGHSSNKFGNLVKESIGDYVTLLIKKRPLVTKITLNKDQDGCLGFTQDNRGRITGITKNSPAARNGLLVDQNILEINSYNAIGLTKSEIRELIHCCGRRVTLTLMQSKIYDLMIEESNPRLIRENLKKTPLSIV